MKTVAIAGVGLIGGSFALALKKAGFTGRIIGVSSPAAIAAALARGVIDDAMPLEQAVSVADLVYLSQPIENILQTLEVVDAHVRPGTLITDAGSTKLAIVERAAQRIHRGKFVGGHPMAGKEMSGVEAADADLFRGRPYVLTEHAPMLEDWLGKMDARIVVMDAAKHDRLVALTSHLPQLVSTALASLIGGEPDADLVTGPAAADMTRLALSSYRIWSAIFATNHGSIDQALAAYIRKLEELRALLQDPAMQQEFDQGARAAREIRK